MNIAEAKVLITGGSSGIGYETARLLKSQGADVVICGTHEVTIQRAAAELSVFGYRADVSQEQDVERLFAFALHQMGGLNVLVNNAGIGRFSPLVETSVDEFQRLWKVNVKGAFLVGKRVATHFISQNTGNIINIGSTASLRGYATGSAYVATKFALAGLTECWRAELRPHQVRVMQINPSEVITDFSAKADFPVTNPERKLKASEIAHVIQAMLAMQDVGFITDASVWATNP